MSKKPASNKPSTDLTSVKAAKAWAKDVKGMYSEELKDRESARKLLKRMGYLTPSGRLSSHYSR